MHPLIKCVDLIAARNHTGEWGIKRSPQGWKVQFADGHPSRCFPTLEEALSDLICDEVTWITQSTDHKSMSQE